MTLRSEYKSFVHEADRQGFILKQLVNGNTPSWVQGKWTQISKKFPDGNLLDIFVMPDAFAIGSDSEPIYVPVYPSTLQAIADVLDAIILSEKLVNIAFESADQKIPFLSESTAGMTSVEEFLSHSDKIFARVNQKKVLRQGHSKSVVIGPNLGKDNLAIYGGMGGLVHGWAIQSYNAHSHNSAWLDYSQLGWLVSRKARLNDKEIELGDIFTDPELCHLVTNDGFYVPRYTNAGLPSGPAKATPPSLKPPTMVPGGGRKVTARSTISDNDSLLFGVGLSILGTIANLSK